MSAAGLIRERRAGRERRFSADRASPFYPELKSLAAKAAARTLARRPKPSEALRAKRAEVKKLLAREGLRNPRVFGSVARGTDTESSDLDILVDAPRGTSLLDMVGAQHAIEDVLGVEVQLLTEGDLPEAFRAAALAEAVPL
jgi:predicted nucleotidyltransferase